MNKKIGLLAVMAAAVLSLTVVSCSKDKVIVGFWQQASDHLYYTDSTGVEDMKNLTDSAVTLCFMDNDSVYLSYGERNPLLNYPPYLLTDSLRNELAALRNTLTRDTLMYELTENTLKLDTMEYTLEKLKGRWMVLSTTDSVDGKSARREITFYKPRK
ncbi:MAG: hypothetical protein J5526_07795 [Bacteroidales bacterium]|nr:hypothetical protein [Bacteroidales bacterium]